MKKEDLRKNIAYIIIALFIFCMILIIAFNKANKSESVKSENQIYEEFIEQYAQETIMPKNMIELYSYRGENDKDILYKSLRKFVEYISYLKKNTLGNNESQQEEYFENHNEEIKDILGIQTKEQFIVFLNYINLKNVNVEEFKYAEVEKASSDINSKYFSFKLHFYYGESPEDITFKVNFALKKNNNILVKYEIPK